MSSKLNLYFKGGKFFKNPPIYLTIDGKEIGDDLRASGFELDEELEPGKHELFLKFAIRKQAFIFETIEGTDLNLELKYSKLWGNFKLKLREL